MDKYWHCVAQLFVKITKPDSAEFGTKRAIVTVSFCFGSNANAFPVSTAKEHAKNHALAELKKQAEKDKLTEEITGTHIINQIEVVQGEHDCCEPEVTIHKMELP